MTGISVLAHIAPLSLLETKIGVGEGVASSQLLDLINFKPPPTSIPPPLPILLVYRFNLVFVSCYQKSWEGSPQFCLCLQEPHA